MKAILFPPNLIFGIILATSNPINALNLNLTSSYAGLIPSGPSANLNASSVYSFPVSGIAMGPSNPINILFSGSSSTWAYFSFMGITLGNNNGSSFIYTPALNGSTAPTLTGVSSGPFSNTSFIYLGTVSGFSSNANNIVYQFASIQSGQAATSNYNLNQITNYTAAASIQSAPAANLNQTINFINSTIVYVSQGPMNFSIGNNFVFTATTTGTGNTSITFSGTSSGAGNNSLTGSSFVVSSTSQTATIISSSSASLLSSSSSTTYTSTLNQIPIAYKTGASMQGLINTHVIFYGAAFRNYFTNNNKAIIQNFLANVYGSNWYAVAMKYGVGRVMMGQSIFIDCQNQTTGFGCAITSANVQALVWAQIGSTLPMDPKALYLVVAAPEVIEAADPTNSSSPSLGQSYCGYHNFIYSNVFDTFKYALVGVPNLLSINMTGIVTAGSIPNIIKPASKCVYAMINPSNASPNGDVQVDMSISIIAHELIECIISPVAMQTWADANNQEAMDKYSSYVSGLTALNTTNGQTAFWNVQVMNGYKYVLPMIWDPQSQSCSLGSTFVSEWSNLGCFTDNIGSSHTLHYLNTSSTSMTVEVCQAACMKGGYLYAGVQYGQECWCDNIMAVTAAPSAACFLPCTGNSLEICGGNSAINVYQLPSNNSQAPSSLLGCYSDSNTTHTLTASSNNSTFQTIEMCRFTCSNYLFYGVSGNSCYCGNTISNGATLLPSASCNINCAGNINEACGGLNAISLYGPSNTWSHVGCYSDLDGNNRALSFLLSTDNYVNSIEFCQTQCAANGYSFAGLENGNQCFCGNSISTVSSKRMPDQSCQSSRTTLCTGNTAEFCGSASMIDIYTSSTTFTAPSAPPNPTTWTNLGCISQSIFTDVRSFTNEFYNTIELCQSQCNIVGYKYAGLVYGKECHCYNTVPATLTAATSPCTMTCTGSASETCGGPNAVQLYSH